MQRRLPKYRRDFTTRAAVASRQITPKSLSVIATIHDYKIIPTSLIVHLIPGNQKNTSSHLHQLYHKGLINRFAFMQGRNLGEFHYYLDNREALELLVDEGVDAGDLDFEEVRRHREKKYCDANDPKYSEEMQGRLMFLKHEAMISRFHGMLELACNRSEGGVELTRFLQGATLWNKVKVPKMFCRDGQWLEQDAYELLPHRPDAFFTLSFPNHPERDPSHFFYEADRHRTNTHKFNRKLRAHFHFIVKQKQHQEVYKIDRVRAVLTETIDDDWADTLRHAAGHIMVSGPKPSPLFWFTTSRLFTEVEKSQPGRPRPTYLTRPDIVLRNIWATPVNDTLHSLLD